MGALQQVRANGGAEVESVFAQRIRKLAFYPYSAYSAFLISTDRQLGRGDYSYCVTLGRDACRRDLSTVFGFIARLCGPERLIGTCTRVWAEYYRNAGCMKPISTEPDRTVLRIYDFPGMHPSHCRLMEGWMIEAMAIVGGKVLDGRETRCTSRGDSYHEFSCSWAAAKQTNKPARATVDHVARLPEPHRSGHQASMRVTTFRSAAACKRSANQG